MRPDADDPGLGGSAEPVAPPQNPTEFPLADAVEIVRAMLRRDFPEKQIADPDGAAIEADALERVLQALARAPQGDPPESVEKLAPQWRNRARDYRDQLDMMLPNRAGQAERDSLLWRARAYETCAEELQFALSAKRVPAPQGDAPPPGPWELVHDNARQRWMVTKPDQRASHYSLESWYKAEAIAVRDALNRVAGGGASSSGSAPEYERSLRGDTVPPADMVGASAPTPEPEQPPNNGAWSDERLRTASNDSVLDLLLQLQWRVARGGTQADEVVRIGREIERRMVRGVGSPQPAPDLAAKIASLKGFEVRSLGEVWKNVWARPDAGFEHADEAVRERLRDLLGVRGASPQPPREDTP